MCLIEHVGTAPIDLSTPHDWLMEELNGKYPDVIGNPSTPTYYPGTGIRIGYPIAILSSKAANSDHVHPWKGMNWHYDSNPTWFD